MGSCTDTPAQLMILKLLMISMTGVTFQKSLFPTIKQFVDSQYLTVEYIKERMMAE